MLWCLRGNMRSLDLFTGYGGIAIGLREYCKPIGYCEIERYAQAIIASRIADGELPIAPIYPDVTKLRGEIDTVDIITGGFPCQDISVAGNGVGLEGKRSGLFFEIIRLAKETRAPFVFLENVPAIRTRGLREVIRAFTEMGYDCRWTCLSAASVGAPHKRERWFLLANSNGSRQVPDLPQSKRRINNAKSLGSSENVANSELNKGGIQSRWSKRTSGKKEANYMDGSWWNSEPNLGRVADGTADDVDRIKALGNGVVPLQVKTAFEILIGINN